MRWLVVALLAVAPPELSVASGFSSAEEQTIAEVAAEWRACLRDRRDRTPWVVRPGTPRDLERHRAESGDDPASIMALCIYPEHAIAIFHAARQPGVFAGIVRHELGHRYGLRTHVPETLMAVEYVPELFARIDRETARRAGCVKDW